MRRNPPVDLADVVAQHLEVDGEEVTAVGELGLLAEQDEGTFVALEGKCNAYKKNAGPRVLGKRISKVCLTQL